MFSRRTAPSPGFCVLVLAAAVAGQTPAPPAGLPNAPGLQKPSGNEAAELSNAIDAALEADRWDEAIARGSELVAFRMRAQGPKNFETVNAQWQLQAYRRAG
jgi:hypothetical protein